MCFHCDNGNSQEHIPTEYRKTMTHTLMNGHVIRKCIHCGKTITQAQQAGTWPHWCGFKYVMIAEEPPVVEVDVLDLISNWRSHPLTATVTLKTGEIKFYMKGVEWKPKT